MLHTRTFGLAGLALVLAACGGERAADDASSGSSSGDPLAADTGVPADPSASSETRMPAFVTDSAATADTAATGDTDGAIRSVYTSLAEADCPVVDRDEETGGASVRCPGTAGYTLLAHDYDARMTVDVVAPGGRAHRLRYSAVITSAFSSLGPRAEWRMRDGAPVALIIRVNAFEDPSVPDKATSYLAVAKITSGEVCVTDRIPPTTPNANAAAQQAADQAASRPCKRDLADERS